MVCEAEVMTITLEIKPEIQDELARQAAARGLEIDAYAASVLEEAARAASATANPGAPAKDIVELFAPLRGLNLEFGRNPSTGRPVDL